MRHEYNIRVSIVMAQIVYKMREYKLRLICQGGSEKTEKLRVVNGIYVERKKNQKRD